MVELQQIHGNDTLIPHLCYKYVKIEHNNTFTDILILFMVVLTMINFSISAHFAFLFYPNHWVLFVHQLSELIFYLALFIIS